MNITIVGAGYVGIITGTTFAYLNHTVTYLDVDAEKMRAIANGEPPIHEPGLEEMFGLVGPRLRCTTKFEDAVPQADVIFICVGTPSQADGSPDLQYVHEAARQIGLHLGPGYTLIVNKSTVPIGSGNWVESIVRESFASRNGNRPDGKFCVASNPEFLKEGAALRDSLYPDRIVIGASETRALSTLAELYRPITDQDFVPPPFLPRPEDMGAVPLLTTGLASAELIKYAANAFLANKISFVNQLADLAERVGADINHISKGIGLDCRIGPRFLNAGLGWGGSCFGKDTAALIALGNEYGVSLPIVEATRHVNCRMRERAVEKLQSELRILKGRTIGILGVSFKPSTDDLRDAPALDIARRLIGRGATVRAHDPIALPRARREASMQRLNYCDDVAEVFEDADAILLATEWPDYSDLDWSALGERMKSKILVDGRNYLDPAQFASLGFTYAGIGRQSL